jgi:hypothetical protein
VKKKVKNQDSMGKTNFFLSTLPFSPWALLATWLHVGAPQKYKKKQLKIHFEQNFTTGSYEVGIGRVGIHGKLVKYLVHSFKRKN